MSRRLLAVVRAAAGGRCDYCRLPESLDLLPFQLDHIIARQHFGPTRLDNLAWCCLHCNKHKGPNIAGLDPITRRLTALYHPRRQRWERHCTWKGPMLSGRTRSGRTTIHVLAMNEPMFLDFRAALIEERTFHLSS